MGVMIFMLSKVFVHASVSGGLNRDAFLGLTLFHYAIEPFPHLLYVQFLESLTHFPLPINLLPMIFHFTDLLRMINLVIQQILKHVLFKVAKGLPCVILEIVVALPLDEVKALSSFNLEVKNVLAVVGAWRDLGRLWWNAVG